jgi:hypothetical protein
MTGLLERIRAEGAASLAALLVAQALARPLAELVPPAAMVAEAARTLAASDAGAAWLQARVAAVVAALEAERGRLADVLPPSLTRAARDLAALPVRPKRATLLAVLDHPPVRQLLRAQVVQTLLEFGRKAAAPFTDNPISRGLKAFSRGGALGSIAGAAQAELERQAAGFADTAVGEVLAGLATELSDPARVKEQAAVRAAVLDGLLGLGVAEVAAIGAPHAPAAVALGRRALAAWAGEPDTIGPVVELLLGAELARPLGDVLGDLGVRELAERHARAALGTILSELFASDAFAAWLAALAPQGA